MHAGHVLNGPTFAHRIVATGEVIGYLSNDADPAIPVVHIPTPDLSVYDALRTGAAA